MMVSMCELVVTRRFRNTSGTQTAYIESSVVYSAARIVPILSPGTFIILAVHELPPLRLSVFRYRRSPRQLQVRYEVDGREGRSVEDFGIENGWGLARLIVGLGPQCKMTLAYSLQPSITLSVFTSVFPTLCLDIFRWHFIVSSEPSVMADAIRAYA